MSDVTVYLGRWGEGKGPTNFCEQEVLSPETVRTLLFKQPLAKGLKVVSTFSSFPLSHLINKCSQTKSTQERATRVRACNYIIIETGQNCEGWWLSGCRGSVAEHWRLKPEVSWVRLPVAADLFHFPLFPPRYIQIYALLLDLPFGFCML